MDGELTPPSILSANVGTAAEGAGHRRGEELPDCWFTPETGFPQPDACCPSHPHPAGSPSRVENKASQDSFANATGGAQSSPHQCLPARVDSEPGSGNQSDHFAHFPSLPRRPAAGSQGGVSPARPQPPLPQRRMDLPRRRPSKGHTRPHSGGFRSLPTPYPPIMKTGGWKLHSRAASAFIRWVSCRPDDPAQSLLLTLPHAHCP